MPAAGSIGEPAGAVAGALSWVWPPFALFKLTHQYGFYASGVFYCALLILLALRIVERPDRTRVGLFGFVLGLAFWQTEQIVPVAAVLIVWTVWRRPRALRQLWLAIPLAAARRAAVDRLEHRPPRRVVRAPLRPVPLPEAPPPVLLADPADDARTPRAVLAAGAPPSVLV